MLTLRGKWRRLSLPWLEAKTAEWSRRAFRVSTPARKPSSLLTLGIETSCDDTSVAILEKQRYSAGAHLHFHERITSNSSQYRGIHPLVALDSHRECLAKLVNSAFPHLPTAEAQSDPGHDGMRVGGSWKRKPDFISVTRGPGMRSNLATGLDTAKGISVALQVPLVGVHHMQGHLLTPRLLSALSHNAIASKVQDLKPDFPFLSLLVSGGHTLFVQSQSLTDHKVLASTIDVALGDVVDKIARFIVPKSVFEKRGNKPAIYGKVLEEFAFPRGNLDFQDYEPPATRAQEIEKRRCEGYDWEFSLPMVEVRDLTFSFAGLLSTVKRMIERRTRIPSSSDAYDEQLIPHEERIALARVLMQIAFEHVASRTVMALRTLPPSVMAQVHYIVLSGGVASNSFLRTIIRRFLDVRGFAGIELIAPPPALCSDNAAMIAWAGMEMFEAGWESDLGCLGLRKWSLDPEATDHGILGTGDWKKHD